MALFLIVIVHGGKEEGGRGAEERLTFFEWVSPKRT
jgi:hypothetical protein